MIQILQYSDEYYDLWNRFIEKSNNGTIFHRLDFLAYHGKKFKENEHHLIWLKGNTIFAVMPFAIFCEDGRKTGKSPFGASFGGLVFSDKFNLKHAIEVYNTLSDYLIDQDLDQVKITPVPHYYAKKPTASFEYMLSHGGYQLWSRDVFSVVKLTTNFMDLWENQFEGRARTSIKKATSNFDVLLDVSVEEFYPILLEDKKRHNNSKPTHTLEDLKFLKARFPDKIFFDIATLKTNGAKAGICYFLCNPQVMMTFYMAQEDNALRYNGPNVLLEKGFKRAIAKKMKYFDFGGSTVGYEIQNLGVAIYKESFGANCFLRETYCKQK